MVFFNVTWMEKYNGLSGTDETLSGGGSFVDEHGYGHELYNFKEIDGKVYGYVQTRGLNNLQRLGAKSSAKFIDDITVVFTAKAKEGGVYIVGWYKNTTVFRNYRGSNLEERKFRHVYIGYIVSARAKEAVLVPPDLRRSLPKIPTRIKGGMGQGNVWYADSELGLKFKKEVLAAIRNYEEKLVLEDVRAKARQSNIEKIEEVENNAIESLVHEQALDSIDNKEIAADILTNNAIARQANVELRQKVEKTAIDLVAQEYKRGAYTVKSVEKENKGWDLEAQIKKNKLKIEVKGLSGPNLTIELTPNEYEQMNNHKENYRLAVVTEALTNPLLHIFSYSKEKTAWLSENEDILVINEFISARCSLKP